MEARKITIIETKNQKKSVIMSAATTLAELKKDLHDNGIDYNDMSFFEGTSKVELKTDASVLPHDVPYKGTITNELVFMLTNANKKIKSGASVMTRAEVYETIKSMGLQKTCKEKFGKNFTMCKTADLVALIQDKEALKSVAMPKVSTPATPVNKCNEGVDMIARAALTTLVKILEYNSTIEDYDKDEVLGILEGKVAVAAAPSKEHEPKTASPYSDDEITAMFAGMGDD